MWRTLFSEAVCGVWGVFSYEDTTKVYFYEYLGHQVLTSPGATAHLLFQTAIMYSDYDNGTPIFHCMHELVLPGSFTWQSSICHSAIPTA